MPKINKGNDEAIRVKSCCLLSMTPLLDSWKEQKHERGDIPSSGWKYVWKPNANEKRFLGMLKVGHP